MCKASTVPLTAPTAESFDPAPGITIGQIRAAIPKHCFDKCVAHVGPIGRVYEGRRVRRVRRQTRKHRFIPLGNAIGNAVVRGSPPSAWDNNVVLRTPGARPARRRSTHPNSIYSHASGTAAVRTAVAPTSQLSRPTERSLSHRLTRVLGAGVLYIGQVRVPLHPIPPSGP